MSARPRPTRRQAVSAVVVVAVVLAGCNALSGAGGDPAADATPSVPVTPAPVPTDAPTPTPGPSEVPGLVATGVFNGDALLDAHTAALDDRSFGLRSTTAVELENGTVVNRTRTTARVGEDGRIYLRSVRTGTPGSGPDATFVRREAWVGDSRSLRALAYPNGTVEYAELSPFLRIERSLTRDSVGVVTAFDTGSSRIVDRIRTDGTTVYLIEARTPWLSGTNATHQVLVGEDGRIRRVRTVRPAVQEENASRLIATVEYTGVDTTSIERPSWYRAAIENTTESDRRPRMPPRPVDTTTPLPDAYRPPGHRHHSNTSSTPVSGSCSSTVHTDTPGGPSATVRHTVGDRCGP